MQVLFMLPLPAKSVALSQPLLFPPIELARRGDTLFVMRIKIHCSELWIVWVLLNHTSFCSSLESMNIQEPALWCFNVSGMADPQLHPIPVHNEIRHGGPLAASHVTYFVASFCYCSVLSCMGTVFALS